ncbi:Hypothetical predicted protein [Mytilus galloprovincialis]|uniref:Uncharacterized protein n=1 Tax=Mytilus galloprovincialis TaxID=29158 RepID=A0A8B6DHS0_MYTGA|nr:Hypothetical predicted protein [Mytilus galloprovincialis]
MAEIEGQDVHGATVSVASQVKKLKTESQYIWKYEGNIVQFLLNTEFLEDLTQSIWAFYNSKVYYAQDTIKVVIYKTKRRYKLIKIADNSEGKWETVRQYENNPVASDSDDESKINKAGNKALRKRNSKGKKAATKPNFNYESSAPSQFNATFPAKNQPFRDPQSWYNEQALYHGQASSSTSGNQRGNQQRQAACSGCG